MINIVRGFVGFIIAVILTVFALFNRQTVEVFYSPVHDPLSFPLYLIILSFLGMGFIMGGFVVWINAGHTRKLTRQQRRQITALGKELEGMKNDASSDAKPPADFFSSLPLRLSKSLRNR
jgi:uncharacterized integral membrane protein